MKRHYCITVFEENHKFGATVDEGRQGRFGTMPETQYTTLGPLGICPDKPSYEAAYKATEQAIKEYIRQLRTKHPELEVTISNKHKVF